jgi:aryl-phospho-beta-D-glucosidase BglC (GH1 family)
VICQLVGEEAARDFWRSYRDDYITKEDIQLLARVGFNSVRVPFNFRLLVTEGDSPALEGVGYELLDRVIRWCREENLYVVLDMHAAPGGQTGDNVDDSWGYPFLFESAASQELTISLWQKLADRYKLEPAVIGYDLLNEPIAPYFDKAQLNPKLEPLYKRIVAAIRRVDPNHVVFMEGAQWGSRFEMFGLPFDDKVAYSFHKYWTEPTQAVIQSYLDFGAKYNVPLWMGESGENHDEWISRFRTMLEQNDVGWCFWPYKKMSPTRCIASIPKSGDWDAVIAFSELPRASFEEIRNSRLPRDTAMKALNNLLEGIKLENCAINEGYLQALGLMTGSR